VAVKLAVVEADATVTDAGTVSNALLLLNETETPPADAAFDIVTVQVELALELRVFGLQESWLTDGGAIREMPADWEPLLSVAVTEAF